MTAPQPMDLKGLIEDRATRIVVCCGAGGVGKTTTSAALALAAAEGELSGAELVPALTGAHLHDAEGIAAALAAEVTEHARRWAGQDALRDEVEALGRPTVELPLLPGPMDVGSLFELAGRLEDHLRSEVAA